MKKETGYKLEDGKFKASWDVEKSEKIKERMDILQELKKEFIIVAPGSTSSGDYVWMLNKETGESFKAVSPIADTGGLHYIAFKKEFKHTKELLDFEISGRGHAHLMGSDASGIIDIYNFDDKAKYNANLITNASKMLTSILGIHDLLLNEYLSKGIEGMNVGTWGMFLETSKIIVEFKKGEND